jgi:hypothetical protein
MKLWHAENRKSTETGSENHDWQPTLTAEKDIRSPSAIIPGCVLCGIYSTSAIPPLHSGLAAFF